jgi:hypoxanthine-guanine phosphoribosyltransferase
LLEFLTLYLKQKYERYAVGFAWHARGIGRHSAVVEFVVGYGIDYAQRDRNLPYIGKVVFDG